MNYEKLGYLTASFKLFHLKDSQKLEFQAHYHEFDKIIVFLSGKVQYTIEGKTYQLFPYDMVFVGHNNVHYLVVDPSVPYERIVIYINPQFLQNQSEDDGNLAYCFEYAKKHCSYVIHLDNENNNDVLRQLKKLESLIADKAFGHGLYLKVAFLEYMILLNRTIIDDKDSKHKITSNIGVSYDENILAVLSYINKNLFNELNVDKIANEFFVSKYYLMRRFKAKTGYSVHQYILNKRLMAAKELINTDISLTQICFDCGFRDYSSFSRCFRNNFGQTPRELRKSMAASQNFKKAIFKE